MPEEAVVRELIKNNYKVAIAESCTGGMIASAIVNVAGASQVFEEGYVTYSNDAKQRLLGVNSQTLSIYGAVSHQVAAQMTMGVAENAGAQAAIAITGIAGPEGGTASKPVGLVYIGCHVNGETIVTENMFKGARTQIRQQSAQRALEILLEQLQQI